MSNSMQWYVLQVYSGSEFHVKKALENCIQDSPLADQFGEIIVPTEPVIEMKSGKRRETTSKFYPSYILIKMHLDNYTQNLVKSASQKILRFIGGTSDKPAPISEKEADRILQRVQDNVGKPKPKILFSPGEVVRVTEGPFADFNGVVEEVNYEKNRLRVAVLIFGRPTPVDLDFSQVEKG